MNKILSVEQMKNEGNKRAAEVRSLYPDLHDVKSIIDQAKADNVFTDELDAVIVWGRLLKDLPFTKVN